MSKVEMKSGNAGIRAQSMNILLLSKNLINSYRVYSVKVNSRFLSKVTHEQRRTTRRPATNQQQRPYVASAGPGSQHFTFYFVSKVELKSGHAGMRARLMNILLFPKDQKTRIL